MRQAPQVRLSQWERRHLLTKVRAGNLSTRQTVRVRIILLAARGWDNRRIARELRTTVATVGLWRRRFAMHRIPGIEKELPRPGRPPQIPTSTLARIVQLHRPFDQAEDDSRSSRAVAREVGTSKSTVLRVWQAHREVNLRRGHHDPWPSSTDTLQRITDFVGLYLNPPHRAVAFSVDLGPVGPGIRGRGAQPGVARPPRDPGVEFRSFLQAIDRETPHDLNVFLLAEGPEGSSSAEVRRWLVLHPRFRIHLLHPLTAPPPNLLDRLLGELSRKRTRRIATPGPLRLRQAMRAHFASLRVAPGPFVWTATAEEIRRGPAPTKK